MTTKSTKTHHYTYIIRHVHGRYYVGRRSTKKDPLLDSYMGSGKWVKSIKDRSTLTKDIIAHYPTFDELKIAEMELIDKYFLDEYCMNVAYSSCGAASGDKHPMYGKTGDKHHFYGQTHTEESRKKISDAMSGRTGELSPNFGSTRTKESKRKMSDNHADFSGENNPSANITDHIATMIKIRIAEGVKTKPIYVEYNTTRDIVNNIRCGRSWKHIII